MDLISVVVIGYNVEKTIQECLESIQKQTYSALEILMVDDGSMDRTREIVEELSSKDSRIRYIRQENQGANAARKKGYSMANGSELLFVDGDDILCENAIELAHGRIQQGNYDFVCFDYFIFESANQRYDMKHPYLAGEFEQTDYLESILERRQAHYLWNKLYRMDFLKQMPFEDIPCITMGDDLAANIRMGLQKPRVLAIKDKLYGYRRTANSVSRVPNPKYLELLVMMQDIESQIEYHHMTDIYREQIDFNYFLNFYYYVVRNKYKYEDYHKRIYQAWKSRKVCFRKNTYIAKYMKTLGAVKILIYLIHVSDLFEVLITSLYSLFRRRGNTQ